MHPIMMSLATQTVGIVNGSTSLMTAASLQKQDRSRWCAIPKNADKDYVLNQIPVEAQIRPVAYVDQIND